MYTLYRYGIELLEIRNGWLPFVTRVLIELNKEREGKRESDVGAGR